MSAFNLIFFVCVWFEIDIHLMKEGGERDGEKEVEKREGDRKERRK